MAQTIIVALPRPAIGHELSEALAARGLCAEIVDDGELEVRFADDERDRLVSEVTSAIETWLADRMLPLVVQPANGGCVVRPLSD